jgi:hypothetical protein
MQIEQAVPVQLKQSFLNLNQLCLKKSSRTGQPNKTSVRQASWQCQGGLHVMA